MTAHACEKCHDTGSLSREIWGDLNCISCDAATERAAINAYVSERTENFTETQLAWVMYQRGKAAASPAWISVDERLPEICDDSVLAFFSNGGIDMVHIQEYFCPITAGLDTEGGQLYSRWYERAGVTHWQPLPAAPSAQIAQKEKAE